MTVNIQSKEVLARLLATENISVEHKMFLLQALMLRSET